MRRWIVGPGGQVARPPPRPCRAADGRRLLRRGRRAGAGSGAGRGAGLPVGRLARRGSPKARRSARSRPCSSQVRGTVYARAKAQDAGYGLETELAEPDGALVASAAAAMEALEALQKPLAALARRLEAVLEDAPDWLDSQARARVDGAINGLGWRRETLLAWISLLARIGGPADPDFVDWLAVERVDGREYDIAINRRWLDPTRPLAERRAQAGARRASSPRRRLRGGDGWDAAEARTGALPPGRRRPSASRPKARSIMPRSSEVLIVTDIKPGRHARARRRLCAADRGGGRRHARPVHRDPAAEGGPRPHRRPARPRRAAAARPARRSDRRRDLGRHLPRRSARLACSAPMRCATASTCPASRCGWW